MSTKTHKNEEETVKVEPLPPTDEEAAAKKSRNYSFKDSKRVPEEKMVEINGLLIPGLIGKSYHSIMCALAHRKGEFIKWDQLVKLVEKFWRKHGTNEGWETFRDKDSNQRGAECKSLIDRLKTNVHTLTRAGKHSYGLRLHERGMVIYYFSDGAMLLHGGTFVPGEPYTVKLPDGRGLQRRRRGTSLSYAQYCQALEAGSIKPDGEVIDSQKLKEVRKPG